MGSKKYRGLKCVYCSERPSESVDHVFAREFFLKSARGNLPTVPACQECNNKKSQLEHYLATVLPFGARHAHATQNLQELCSRRIAKNAKLSRQIREQHLNVWTDENGLLLKTSGVPINSQSIIDLFQYIGKALLWHHWNEYLPSDYGSKAFVLSKDGMHFFDDLFVLAKSEHVSADLGDGTISYIGARDLDDSHTSAWRFNLYGGIRMVGDAREPSEVTGEIGVITGDSGINAYIF